MFNLNSNQWTVFSFVVMLAGAGWIYLSSVTPGEFASTTVFAPQAGFAAPEIRLATPEGVVISLSELRGQPVLINFWASWCGPCRAEMPAMQRVYQQYHDKGLEILAVNATNQDSPSAAVGFAQQYQLTFPVLLDTNGDVSRRYQVRALPSSYFVGPDGVIQEVIIGGPMAEALLKTRIERLFQGSP